MNIKTVFFVSLHLFYKEIALIVFLNPNFLLQEECFMLLVKLHFYSF